MRKLTNSHAQLRQTSQYRNRLCVNKKHTIPKITHVSFVWSCCFQYKYRAIFFWLFIVVVVCVSVSEIRNPKLMSDSYILGKRKLCYMLRKFNCVLYSATENSKDMQRTFGFVLKTCCFFVHVKGICVPAVNCGGWQNMYFWQFRFWTILKSRNTKMNIWKLILCVYMYMDVCT
jgi:hypothetical protein